MILELNLFDAAAAGADASAPVAASAAADAQPQTEAAPSDGADKNAEFEKLIKGDYKEQFEQRMKENLKRRFKESSSLKAKVSQSDEIINMLKVKYGITTDFSKIDIHIHAPEGAVPKDGPSAGITLTTALLSVLTKRSVKGNVAMTGEVTLQGRVLPIGGLKEKAMAAYREGIKTVIIPFDNQPNLQDVDIKVKERVKCVPVKTIDQAISVKLN